MASNTRDRFQQMRVEPVTMEDGRVFHVRPLSGLQLERLLADGSLREEAEQAGENIRALARVACCCLCEEDGTRVYQDGEESVPGEAGVDVLRAVFDKALEISGLGDDQPGEA